MVFSFLALLIAQEARHAKSAVDLHNAFFGVGGKFAELFPTRDEREGLRKHLSIGRFSAFERFWPNRKKLHRKIASLDSRQDGQTWARGCASRRRALCHNARRITVLDFVSACTEQFGKIRGVLLQQGQGHY
jgi:hypothetical protein